MSAILLLFAFVTPDMSYAKDLSEYPCTVFNAEACFRLPAGTRLDYSIPADFEIYRVSNEYSPVAVIYVGDAPKAMGDAVPVVTSDTKHGVIRIYRGGAGAQARVNIYITAKDKRSSTIHIAADITSESRSDLVDLLSSLRPCRHIKSGGQHCPVDRVWSQEIIRAVSP